MMNFFVTAVFFILYIFIIIGSRKNKRQKSIMTLLFALSMLAYETVLTLVSMSGFDSARTTWYSLFTVNSDNLLVIAHIIYYTLLVLFSVYLYGSDEDE